MAQEEHDGKKQPQLRIIDKLDDSQEVPRLSQPTEKTGSARKKTSLRRSQEMTALARDLDEQESVNPDQTHQKTPEEGLEEPKTMASPLRIPPAFFLIVACAFLLLLGLGIFMAMGGRNRNKRDRSLNRSRENLELAQQEQKKVRQMVEELSLAIDKYSSATTIAEKLAFTRQPERVKPLMEGYYETHRLEPQTGAKLVSQYPLPIENRSFVILTASFPDESRKIFLAEVDNDLKVTIDWESDVCYQPVDLTHYIASRPTESVTLRLFALPDNFYVFDFADSTKYQCFKLTFRDSEEYLFGYVERDSPTNRLLTQHFVSTFHKRKKTPEPLLLKVRFLKESKPENGILIEEFISPRWANINEFGNEE